MLADGYAQWPPLFFFMYFSIPALPVAYSNSHVEFSTFKLETEFQYPQRGPRNTNKLMVKVSYLRYV